MNRIIIVTAIFSIQCSTANAQFVPNVFDVSSGTNTYYVNGIGESLADSNWVSTFAGLNPNSGFQFLASGNGNQNHNFVDIGLAKNLGGVVQDLPYKVSFYIAKYLDLQPIQFSDFSKLRIGGPTGTMVWTDTPTPVTNNQWYKWTGTYTPSVADVGGSFTFDAVFTLRSRSTIAIDGIMVPEPSALFVAVTAILLGSGVRRIRRV